MCHGKCQCKCKTGWYSVVQIIKTLLGNNDGNTAAVFTIFVENKGKARNRDLGFTSAGYLLPVSG